METNTLFRCRYCHKACKNSNQLEKHERTHQEETVVTCRGCGEHFESKDVLARHPCTGSDKGNFCAKTHATDTELQEHEQGHFRGVEKFQCKQCNCDFDMVYDLQRHLEMHNHTNKYIYMCPKCSKRFESKLSLECHLQEHEKGKSGSQDPLRAIPSNDGVDITGSTMSSRLETFFCNICGQTFNREGQFRQHLDGHFQRNLYECAICNSRFAGPFLLQHHMEVHSSARPYMCSQCGTGYRQKDLLIKHFKIHGVPKMDNRDQPQEASRKEEVKQTGMFTTHELEESDASALIDKKVNQHLDSDEGNFFDLLQTCNSEDSEGIFWASQAGKDDFTKINPLCEDLLSRTALQNEQLHPKQLRENSLPMFGEGGDQSVPLAKRKGKRRKSFPCDICNKVFKFKSHCQRHRRIHTGEMPFKCGVCSRKFRWRSSLVTHACLKYRGKDKPSTSDISLVHSAEHLNDHQQGHSGECVPEINGHGEVTRNANDGFICSLCGGNFATEILLQSHTCVHDGRKSDPATSEIQMQWQSDRVDPAKRSKVVSSTMPTENSQSILLMNDAGPDQTSHPAVGIVPQKQLQGSRKWGISRKTRQPRVSTPSTNTAVTSHSSAVKEKKKVFACEFCYKVFLSKNKYLRHKRLHTGEKPFECNKCNRRFMWASSLASHKKTHEKRDVHVYATNDDVISVIDSEQSDEATLEQSGWIPEVKEERGSDKAFICLQKECGKSFISEHELRCHASVHEVYKYFSRSAPRTETGSAQVSYRAKDVTQKSNDEPKHNEKCHTRKFEGTTSETGLLSIKRNRRQFVCEYCNKVFNHRSRYLRHLPIHTGEMAYQCNLCPVKFKWRSSLDSHKKSHNKNKGETSNDDSLPFIDSEQSGEPEQPDGNLEGNERTDEMFICLVCGMDFATEMQLQSHTSTHEDTKYHPISVPRTDTDVAQLSGRVQEAPQQIKSEKSKGNEEPHTGRIGNPLETDKLHKQNKNKKTFECEVCSKVFTIKNNYHRHQLLHTEEKPFQCAQCEKAFKWGSSLDSHIKSHNKKKGPTSSSSDYVSLIANELTQEHSEAIPGCSPRDEKSASTSLKPFVCPQCGMDYVSDLELQIHMYIHGDEAYLQRVQTRKHMDGTDPEKIDRPVMHTTQHPTANDPPHQIHEPESRGISSTEKSGTSGSTTLERGTIQKQTNKNYVCEICGKAFGSSNHYRRHMPLHTGEMSYECERCNKKFKWRSSLDSHRRSHARKDAMDA